MQDASSKRAAPDAHQQGEHPRFQAGTSLVDRVLDERYRVLRVLGAGGMGAVYVAEHLALRKEVALKVVRAELAGNGEVAARFAREAMATARFEHPHVASAIDYGTLPEGGAYFVMQLVRGTSLRALLAAHGRLPWRRACALLAQVADALSAAKGAGIVHRDLKPDNVLVEAREDGSELVKVLDFGIARISPREERSAEPATADAAPASRELTRVGTVMGTPGYMPPEQAVGDRVDHRADLYALGVVLWEAISGRELWDAPDLTTVVGRQMSEQVPLLRVMSDPSVPVELDELIQALTARLPKDRPDSASAVRDGLRRLSLTRAEAIDLGARLQAAARALIARAQAERARFAKLPKDARRMRAAQALAISAALAVAAALALSTPKAKPKPDAAGKLAATTSAEDDADRAPPEPERDVPIELDGNLRAMLDGKTLRERRDGAQALLSYGAPERIAEPIRRIAELEVATTCKARREAIERMLRAPDPRFVAPVRRRHEAPRSGCGFLRLQDCYACNRADLKRALETLDAKRPPAATTKTARSEH